MNRSYRIKAGSVECCFITNDLKYIKFAVFFFVRTLDEGLTEAISSLLWVAPRLQTDVAELKVIADLLRVKYGQQYADVSAVTFAEPS
jgi:vacuolar protein sorting-associated protein IST1